MTECKHQFVECCPCCGVVYCLDCRKEWVEKNVSCETTTEQLETTCGTSGCHIEYT